MKKATILEVDCTGVELNSFTMETSSSEEGALSKSKILIIGDSKILGYVKVFDDGNIELVKYED